MIRTLEAVIDRDGIVRPLGTVRLAEPRRTLVTILLEEGPITHETALLGERALAEEWSRPEEDSAWSYLQPARQFDGQDRLTRSG